MFTYKATLTHPEVREAVLLRIWEERITGNQSTITIAISKPSKRYKYITLDLHELSSYERTVRIFEEIYRKYSRFTEKTIRHYAETIASKLLELRMIGLG